MRKAKVSIDQSLVGYINELDTGYEFYYTEQWLNNPEAIPVSLTLPLQKEAFKAPILFPFFDGLIPEGWLLDLSIKNWKLNPKDRFGLLLRVCRDTIGIVTIEPVEDQ